MRDVTGVRVKLGLAAVCGLVFAVLSLTVARPPTADLFDVELHSWFLSHRPAWLISLALDVTATGTSLALAAAIIVAALSLVRGRWSNKASSALILSAVLMTGVGLRLWLSDVIGRPRPSMSDWAGYASGFAFPSGHTTASALTAGLLLWLVARRLTGLPRVVMCAVVVAWAVAVGLTRAFLGVHWPTDVLGAWLFAATWLLLSAALLSARESGSRAAELAPRPRRP
jgi:undecaprenyl-diphosphatase